MPPGFAYPHDSVMLLGETRGAGKQLGSGAFVENILVVILPRSSLREPAKTSM